MGNCLSTTTQQIALPFHRLLGLRAMAEGPATMYCRRGAFFPANEIVLSHPSPLTLHSPPHFFTPRFPQPHQQPFPQPLQVVTPNLVLFRLKNQICGSLVKGSEKEQEKLQFMCGPYN